MERVVGEDWGWQHIEDGEENAPSHVRASLVGPQVLVPTAGRPPRARHLAGDLLLRVRRSAEAQGLRHASDLIEVENLTKRFRKTVAVDDLSFKIREGAITGFLGPNGAGKTTTLRVILGLVHPTAGRATVMGRLYRQLESPTQQVGAVLEATDFHPGPLRAKSSAGSRCGNRNPALAGRGGSRARRPSGCCGAPRRGLLARNAPASQPRGGAARRSPDPRARRAGERARPTGNPLAARVPALACGGGADDLHLESRPRGGRADRRRGRDHPSRQVRRAGERRPSSWRGPPAASARGARRPTSCAPRSSRRVSRSPPPKGTC